MRMLKLNPDDNETILYTAIKDEFSMAAWAKKFPYCRKTDVYLTLRDNPDVNLLLGTFTVDELLASARAELGDEKFKKFDFGTTNDEKANNCLDILNGKYSGEPEPNIYQRLEAGIQELSAQILNQNILNAPEIEEEEK